MKLVVNSYGAYIRKQGDCFVMKVEDKKEMISSKRVEQILVSTAATISTDALKLAIENNIDVVFLEQDGTPYGRVWHSKLGSITTIRRNQLKLTELEYGTRLVKEWIGQKIENQIQHLMKLKYNRSEEKKKCIDDAVMRMKEMQQSIQEIKDKPIEQIRNQLEGYEGTAGKIYFQVLGELIPDQYVFKGRSRNPAKDYFNCMLNYAYRILYSNVEKSCIIAGLDPYIGIMHTDNYNKKALIFDLVEMYRGYMDEVVFGLFSKRKVKKEMFNEVPGGYYLNKEGKQLLGVAVNERFAEKIKYRGKNIEIENIIGYDCHRIANQILEEVG